MSDLPKKAEDKINVLGIASIGVVATLLVWASVVALQAYYNSTNAALEQEREVYGQATQVRVVRAEQEGQLDPDPIETVDAKKGTVRVPIEYAMNQVVNLLNQQPAASAVPAVTEAHDLPTVPAVWGRPPDNAQAPGAAPDPGAPGAAVPGGDAAGANPAGNTPAPGTDAGQAGNPGQGGNAPAGGGGNSPQPATPDSGGAPQ